MSDTVKDLNYWKNNCEAEYLHTPICVLSYITELEMSNKELLEALKNISEANTTDEFRKFRKVAFDLIKKHSTNEAKENF